MTKLDAVETGNPCWADIMTSDPATTRAFYGELLGWEVTGGEDKNDSAAISPGEGVAYIGFETIPDYVPPVWPGKPGKQAQMLHLSFQVSDLDAAIEHALELGARLAGYQPQERTKVLLDPDGHPFCLYGGE